MQRLIAAVALTVLLVASKPAEARDLSGNLGLGANLDSSLVRGLSLKYWVSDLGLQGLFAFDAIHSDAQTPGRLVFRPGVRVLYAMTRTRLTNLYVGGGVSTEFGRGARLIPAPEAAPGQVQGEPTIQKIDAAILYLDVVVGAEIFLGDHFAVSGNVTFSSLLGGVSDQDFVSAAWGAGFHWYFGKPKKQ